ncbi:hypothetical protein GCM10008171_19930 [Methylopila jiangsuensis]|uniref:Uncharacterized protein n=1 Tax=Methylopila jiangsuensis TaxID=586230 RepID=A0A9W6JIN1_9HYPH|nr:hypothetical protein GCM10008171_19930 [Methylopila jiangsuensis]
MTMALALGAPPSTISIASAAWAALKGSARQNAARRAVRMEVSLGLGADLRAAVPKMSPKIALGVSWTSDEARLFRGVF